MCLAIRHLHLNSRHRVLPFCQHSRIKPSIVIVMHGYKFSTGYKSQISRTYIWPDVHFAMSMLFSLNFKMKYLGCRHNRWSILRNCRVYRSLEFDTDHLPVVSTLSIRLKRLSQKRNLTSPKFNLQALGDQVVRQQFELELKKPLLSSR